MIKMKRRDFDNHIENGSFKELFINLMGWNQVYGQTILPRIEVEETSYKIHNICERNGFQILTCNVATLPSLAICKKIDIKLRRIAFDYICIFTKNGTSHNLWVAPIKKNGKREIITIEYESASQANFVFSKIDGLSFGIDEQTTITDVKERVHKTFALNSEKVTKSFYTGFKTIMNKFTGKISGLFDDVPTNSNVWKQWYASVMLNRLMFCYFIQKKNFLNNDKDYLRNKLEWVRAERGANRFYETFYKGFLTHLFHEGLNKPIHDNEFQKVYGRIPFLNGGLFGLHLIESSFPQLNIEDCAFQELFNFLDTWNWHLDTRLESDQKDINPDVLGYIFEQYVNDKAEMGAFYTQEDITEHIAKNCILPYILNKLFNNQAYSLNSGYASRVLQNNPTKYIYDSIKNGYTTNWKEELPEYIKIGITCSESELVESRQRWNEKPDSKFGLKKENWRDTIDRFKRCDEIIQAVKEGRINCADDFITYNLDIRAFALDLIVLADSPTFIKDYFDVIYGVKVLDPACGSGAFLFAAMNVLEPLYEELLSSMAKEIEYGNPLFSNYLDIINQFKKNPQFSIYTHIAIKNLYGVDIMREAVETAKLRLFLKMVSAIEANPRSYNMGLSPLPDLDFNICSGNTLTGSASINDTIRYKEKLERFAEMHDEFNDLILYNHENMERITELKSKMNSNLIDIEKSMTRQNDTLSELDVVISDTRPMQWSIRYYSILKNRGFDIVIGNPPYRENNKLAYSVDTYDTSSCGNVYTCMLERAWELSRVDSYVGMIVQLPIVCTDRMAPAQSLLQSKKCWLYNFDDRPGKLFENLQHIRVTILITTGDDGIVYSSKYNRWYSETRNVLFNNLTCATATCIEGYDSIPKIGNSIVKSIIRKIIGKQKIAEISNTGDSILYYHNAPLYFTRGTNFLPFFSNDRGDTISSSVKPMSFISDDERDICCSLLNSTLFYMWYVIFSDCRHLNVREIEQFPLGLNTMSVTDRDELVSLCDELMRDLNKNKVRKVTNGARNGRVEYDEFKPKPSKPIMDKIDIVLARHFQLNPEELDFILNYDVKFRMSDDV